MGTKNHWDALHEWTKSERTSIKKYLYSKASKVIMTSSGKSDRSSIKKRCKLKNSLLPRVCVVNPLHKPSMFTWDVQAGEHHCDTCYLHCFCLSGWRTAVCQRSAVMFWSQLWGPTRSIWQNWTWAETISRIQEFYICVVYWRTHTADWELSGSFSVIVASLLCFRINCISLVF